MTLSVSSIRQDRIKSPGKGIKCGRGYISQGEKCNSSGTRAKIENAAQIGGGLVGLGGTVGSMAAMFSGRPDLAIKLGRAATAGNVVAGAAMVSKGKRTKDKELVKAGKDVLVGSAVGAALDYGVNVALKKRVGGGATGKGSSLYAGPEPKRDPVWGRNGFELRDTNKQHARWQRRTKEIQNLENSFKQPSDKVETIRKLNRIYKGPSAKRDRKDSKKASSIWATGSTVTDGENYYEM